MFLVAFNQFQTATHRTEAITLADALGERPGWFPGTDATFVLANDDGQVIEPGDVAYEIQRRVVMLLFPPICIGPHYMLAAILADYLDRKQHRMHNL